MIHLNETILLFLKEFETIEFNLSPNIIHRV